jgi:hypothetical protein
MSVRDQKNLTFNSEHTASDSASELGPLKKYIQDQYHLLTL